MCAGRAHPLVELWGRVTRISALLRIGQLTGLILRSTFGLGSWMSLGGQAYGMIPLGHSCMDMAEIEPPAGGCWPREPPTPNVSISPGVQGLPVPG